MATTVGLNMIADRTSLVNPALKSTLEKFIEAGTTNSKDREKALRILGEIDSKSLRRQNGGDNVKFYRMKVQLKRQNTANPKINNELLRLNRFSTTYVEHYPKKEQVETVATRPSSTQNIISRPLNQYRSTDNPEEIDQMTVNPIDNNNSASAIGSVDISDYNGCTSYDTHFSGVVSRRPHSATPAPRVTLVRTQPDRCATASGARCNNPHPHKEFLLWRYPRKKHNSNHDIFRAQPMDSNLAQITDSEFDKVMRGMCRSTYQIDYRNSDLMKSEAYSPYYLQPEIKAPKHLKISTQRIDYDRPPSSGSFPRELQVPRDRYSSNTLKQTSSFGIIPGAVNKIYMHSNTRTTYDEDVNDRAKVIHGKIIEDIQNKIDLSKLHNIKDIERALMENNNMKDKEALLGVLDKLNEPTDYKRKSFVRKPYYYDGAAYSSQWPGPL